MWAVDLTFELSLLNALNMRLAWRSGPGRFIQDKRLTVQVIDCPR